MFFTTHEKKRKKILNAKINFVKTKVRIQTSQHRVATDTRYAAILYVTVQESEQNNHIWLF